MNYRKAARDAARCFLADSIERVAEIVEWVDLPDHTTADLIDELIDDCDPAIVPTARESLGILDQLARFEATEGDEWEGLSPREALICQARLTFVAAARHHVGRIVRGLGKAESADCESLLATL